ncbi:MAG TPA: hypothetical protein VJ717_19410 [Gemmatimonadaceae bacterium]|nr:hypothetical protein [Gemmatimonadaceae bacterium]
MLNRLTPPFAALFFASALSTGQAQPVADPVDVGSIEAIIRASYEVVSGPAGAPRDWRRDSTLYAPNAVFTALNEVEGKPIATTVTADEYRRMVNGRLVANGFFEREVGARIERFGNVAIVRSVYELRRSADGPVHQRGVNYFTLYFDGSRWWITSMVWDQERPRNPLPKTWTGKTERVNMPQPPNQSRPKR